ncbi:MAG: tRNA pseudouridine(13) synthase TruD [Candidatus Freyarchaeota archaeon]
MNVEEEIGILFFMTDTPGVGGRLRVRLEDFIVEEVTPEGRILRFGMEEKGGGGVEEKGGGDYCVFVVERYGGYDTFETVRVLARALGVSRKRFSYAGVKDKRAVAVQRMSVWRVDPERLRRVRVKGLTIREVCRSSEKVRLGGLLGNRFKVNVREVRLPLYRAEERVVRIIEELKSKGGMPNFYGHQRFGVVRPLTHVVGLKILRGDYEGAAMDFLAKVYPLEGEDAKDARAHLLETGDFKEALRRFPERLRYERAMLNHLVNSPRDYVGAFRRLPRGLTRMFIHAAQSYIFNLTLSLRKREGLPLNTVLEGDYAAILLRGVPSTFIKVDGGNVEKVRALISKGRAALALPVVGYDTVIPPDSPSRKLVEEVLSKVGVTMEMFRVPSMPELAARGGFRTALVNPQALSVARVSRDKVGGGVMVRLVFTLPKGSYATCLLREVMKTNPAKY